uniref:Uncharacterized protein n=1 Tax=Biomphalaria glabrata TaxID=6526 RepID=A0A2C9M5Q4_BIOGL
MSVLHLVVICIFCGISSCNGYGDGGYQNSRPNLCWAMKCQNGGKCVTKLNTPQCECPDGFYGLFCQIKKVVDPCSEYTCFNGGICEAKNYNPVCKCPPGYKGEHCELAPICPKIGDKNCLGKFCSEDSHCSNGDICCASSCGGGRCTTPDYEDNIDACTELCFNGGHCLYNDHKLYCKCKDGFFGDRCQSRNKTNPGTCPDVTVDKRQQCYGRDCTNDGDCFNREKCCTSECGEKTCQKIDQCHNFCRNGGDCIVLNNEPMCICPYGITGSNCELVIPPRDGQCPNPRKFSICLSECLVDDQCPQKQKCCKTSCGGSVCSDPVTIPDVEKPCLTTVCPFGHECRVVVYSDTIQPEERCVPKVSVPKDSDTACHKLSYQNSLLVVQETDPETYRPMKCDGPRPVHRCLKNTFCVDDGYGGATCCRGRPPSVDPIKFGSCPKMSLMAKVNLTSSVFCQVDDDCKGDMKCCDSPCGGHVCSTPVRVHDKCPKKCPNGFFCDKVQRPAPCPSCLPVSDWRCVALDCSLCSNDEHCVYEGEICHNKLLISAMELAFCRKAYSCSPVRKQLKQHIDQCGGCKRNEVCVDTKRTCSMGNCNSYRCVPLDECGGCSPDKTCTPVSYSQWKCVDKVLDYILVPEIICQKCQQDEVCVDTNIKCVTEPCPSFKCLRKDQVPCPLKCTKPKTCQITTPGCPYSPHQPCELQPMPQCVTGFY